ncbi:MAG TPA: FAD-binding oxidoreductase [Dongiaceae bacterium]|nr:FAD-binding oxidoreductase [Dongiaceae bacterium]
MTGVADIIIIGGGIAGASLAAELCGAGAGRVLVLEMESQPGYHATGRSAAMYEPCDGAPLVRALTRASGSFFADPPSGFVETPLLSPRGVLMLGYEGDEAAVETALQGGYEMVDAAFARARLPIVKTDGAVAILWDGTAQDIDVDALHAGRLRALRRSGGKVVVEAKVEHGARQDGVWKLKTTAGDFEAPVIVDAAGAWADQVARACGVRPVGLQPKRRSAAIIAGPDGARVQDWPEILPADVSFYCKPMGGKLMLSPAEEEPMEPHDAWADDLRLAQAAERLETMTEIRVQRLERSWGGLRTFAPDGLPVVGFDPDAADFFWLAGQGGYGIQTSPAMSRLAAALLAGTALPVELAKENIGAETFSPNRFR